LLAQVVGLFWYDFPARTPQASPGGPRLKILLTNVYEGNDQYDRLRDLIDQERPDIVALVEYSRNWAVETASFSRAFPVRFELPAGARGIAFWLRDPRLLAGEAQFLTVPEHANPSLSVPLRLGSTEFVAWVVHPPNPLGRRGRSRGPGDIRALGRQIAANASQPLILGDLNRTDGSPLFHEFVRTTRTRDSRLGFGRQSSWPSMIPFRLPIDHVLVPPGLAVVERRLGPSIGSDHLPVIVVLAPVNDSTQ
jgi:endonuclease/exonuclease/phosphatase (EEP) superfamily protein YafD